MIARTASYLVRAIAGVAAGLALACALLIWRLAAGPISLDALAPYMVDALSRFGDGAAVRIDHSLVSFGPGGRLEIVLRGVALERRDGGGRLALPELLVEVSPRAALAGVIAPTRIILQAPELRVERSREGVFQLGLGDDTAAGTAWAMDVLHQLAAADAPRGPLGWLREVAIADATLTLEDHALGVAWHARSLDARLLRSAAGASGVIALVVAAPAGGEAEFHGDLRYSEAAERLDVALAFAGLRPALFANADSALAPLAALDLPASGELRVSLDTARLRAGEAHCELLFGEGRLVHPQLKGGSLAVASGRLDASYDPAGGRIKLAQLRLDLGGPKVELSGAADTIGDGVTAAALPKALNIAGELRLADVPLDALPNLWPEALSPRTRSWVTEHVHDGAVTEATARIAGRVDLSGEARRPMQVESFAGTLAYRGLTIEYFRPLAPLRGVDGSARFDLATLDLKPSSGAVKAVRLTGGAAKLAKLDTNDEEIAIDLGLKGPLRDVLEVLDSKPLEYARSLSIDPGHVAGDVDGELHFAFPLKHDLTLAMVEYGARARLSGVAVEKVLVERDMTAGELKLQLDRSALRLDGTARLADVPVSLSWMEALTRKDAARAHYTLKARLDDADRQRIGFDLPLVAAAGPVAVAADYTLLTGKRAAASVKLDLTEVALGFDELNWRKPAGVAGFANIDLDLVDGRVRSVRQAAITSEGLDARFAARFDEIGLAHVEAPRLIIGASDLVGALDRRPEGGWRVEMHGASLDASAILAKLDKSTGNEEAGPPLVIDASVDRLILASQREAQGVRAQLFSDGLHWQALSIDAGVSREGKATLRFGQAAGDRRFRLATDDLGALLRLLDISDAIAGGNLEATGQAEDSGPRRAFRGKVDGADYRLLRAPVVARLLSLASLSGIGALLSGEGIPFTRLKGDFVVADGRLDIAGLRAYGGALGIKADGVYDFANDAVDVSGTVVPAYTINSILGNIPILGQILVGGEGEGIFGANFRVAGRVSDLKMTVNPLSAIAPGVLRKLFLFEAPEPPPARTGSNQPR